MKQKTKQLQQNKPKKPVKKSQDQTTNIQFVDNRPETAIQKKAQEAANNSKIVQKTKNTTGMPDNLKSGVENMSGIDMSDVKVHYNSPKPAQLQAHGYTQGSNIHIAPGQEKHLPHEAWHVVQQKQGRVKPTLQMKTGVNINDDKGLEKEADIMGGKAIQKSNRQHSIAQKKKLTKINNPVQFAFFRNKIIKGLIGAGIGAVSGLAAGATLGAGIGGLTGGLKGMGVGAGIGALVGLGVGAVSGLIGGAIAGHQIDRILRTPAGLVHYARKGSAQRNCHKAVHKWLMESAYASKTMPLVTAGNAQAALYNGLAMGALNPARNGAGAIVAPLGSIIGFFDATSGMLQHSMVSLDGGGSWAGVNNGGTFGPGGNGYRVINVAGHANWGAGNLFANAYGDQQRVVWLNPAGINPAYQ